MTHAAYVQAAIKLYDGLRSPFARHYIASALPGGWHLAGQLEMRKAFDVVEGGEYVFISAESDRFQQAGIKHLLTRDAILAGIDPQALYAELALLIANECKAKGPGRDAIRFALVGDGARPPTRGSDGASGYDLYAPREHYIAPGQIVVIHTGVHLELPRDHEGQVRPRSSMSKRGLLVQIGTIDEDYRGEIGATIVNVSREAQQIQTGDRIAQLVIARVEHREWELVPIDELSTTKRGTGGFGSTGR